MHPQFIQRTTLNCGVSGVDLDKQSNKGKKMKPFEYYSKHDVPYPTKGEYTKTFYYKNGERVGTLYPASGLYTALSPEELKQCVKEKVFDEKAYKEKLSEWRDSESKLLMEFKKDLFEELDIVDNPKNELLFSKAWEHGHSAGFHEVYVYACYLVDLIK